jgi:formylglycine-generating enzyme required for sulfatase activity
MSACLRPAFPGALVSVLLASVLVAPGAAQETGRSKPGPAASRASIRVRPERVHPRQVVKLSAALDPPAPAGARFRWTAAPGAGTLFQDDLPEVEWRAPRDGSEAAVTVEVDGAGGSSIRAEARIAIHRPTTDGMVRIPRGPYLRGDIGGTANTVEVKTIQNAADEPSHVVELDGFWIDRYPVTHAEYARYLDEALAQGLARVEDVAVFGEHEGSWVPLYYFQSFEKLIPRYRETRNARKAEFLHWISHDGSRFRVKEGKERHPVVDVSWFGAAVYAAYHGKMLPSEAQWEKAARGSDGRRFPWGSNLPTSYHGDLNGSYGELAPVGYFSPAGDSPFGVADMLSTCVEWTNDWFNHDYYADYAGERPLRNPRGPFWGRSHAIRGSPTSLQYPAAENDEAVSFRYSWRFEFFVGDLFANRNTTFRTALEDDAPYRGTR